MNRAWAVYTEGSMVRLLLMLLLAPRLVLPAGGVAADLARKLQNTNLDPAECYKVRELTLTKEDVRLYFTNGHLIFGQPLEGAVRSAVFVAGDEGGDGEILVFAPSRGERLSLAVRTGSPTFDERFGAAVMVFDDDTHQAILERLRTQQDVRKSAEMGAILAQEWTPVVRNLTRSFEIRLVYDLLDRVKPEVGFFYAALSGRKLGNFDLLYDPQAGEQITIGQVKTRNDRAVFDIWTRFTARSFRMGTRSRIPPAFNLTDYRIDATIEPSLSMRVVTQAGLTPLRTLRVLGFDLSQQMRVTEALVDGKPAEVLQYDSMRSNLMQGKEGNEVFLVVPAEELETGRRHEVEFRHYGSVISDAGHRVYYVGSRTNWYPNFVAQFAHYDVTFRYPQELDLVAPGDVVEQRAEYGLHVVRWRPAAPLRFFGFNLGDYERLEVHKDSFSVEVCANRRLEPSLRPESKQLVIMPPPSWSSGSRKQSPVILDVDRTVPKPAARLSELGDLLAGAFVFMAERLGPPPLRHLTVSPIPGAFGQGFPGLIYLSTLSYLPPEARPKEARTDYQQLFFSEILLAHEVGHQWWGNVVTAASYKDEWLMEALANYSALLYLEKRKGRQAVDSVLAEYKRHLLQPGPDGRPIESAGPIIWGLRLQSLRVPEAWRTITYEKGSWIIHMLRRRMGDERFWNMLLQLRRRYEYQQLSTEQFRQLASEFLPSQTSDPTLEGFFENWVYSTGVPALTLGWKASGRPPAVKVSCTLEQSEVPSGFSMSVPVVFLFRDGKSVTQWLETDEKPVRWQISVRQTPSRVLLDPDNSVLAIHK